MSMTEKKVDTYKLKTSFRVDANDLTFRFRWHYLWNWKALYVDYKRHKYIEKVTQDALKKIMDDINEEMRQQLLGTKIQK